MPRVSLVIGSLVEAAVASWVACPCGCKESNRVFVGTTDADEDTAFVLLWEHFNADEQHHVHAKDFASSPLAKARLALAVQPAYALSMMAEPDERGAILLKYGSSTTDTHLKDCQRHWLGPRLHVVEPGSGKHVRESSPFPFWGGDPSAVWETGLIFGNEQPLRLVMAPWRQEGPGPLPTPSLGLNEARLASAKRRYSGIALPAGSTAGVCLAGRLIESFRTTVEAVAYVEKHPFVDFTLICDPAEDLGAILAARGDSIVCEAEPELKRRRKVEEGQSEQP
jgi:hypothetical protein